MPNCARFEAPISVQTARARALRTLAGWGEGTRPLCGSECVCMCECVRALCAVGRGTRGVAVLAMAVAGVVDVRATRLC
jgi:hypothetical protein